MKTFKGYRRPNGKMGIRNHVIVINSTGELASLTQKVSELVPNVIPVVHQGGQFQFDEDMAQTKNTLKGIAGHPNVSAALFLVMQEDDVGVQVTRELKKEGHSVHYIVVEKLNSITDVLDQGRKWLEEAVLKSKKDDVVTADISELIVGLQCGGSDAWSGITANPAIGVFSDLFIKDGGTSVLAETTEAVGAEHILANRALNSKVRNDFLNIVKRYEKRAQAVGYDIKVANPSPGNKAGGLTTLEEKSLGCIKKGGTTTLMEVVDYAQSPSRKGLIFMDTPGYDVESVVGLVAGGAQIILFSTGKGSPTGSPIAPVVKVGTNQRLYENMSDHIDVNAGKIIDQNYSITDVGKEIYKKVIDVANGKTTAAEKYKNREFSIWRLAETI